MAGKNTETDTDTETDENAARLVEAARAHFESGATRPLAYRKGQLLALNRLFVECEAEILDALAVDMRKSAQEAILYEVEIVKREIRHMLRNLDEYASPKQVPLNLLGIFDRAYTLQEPYGVVLIIGTWNYPFLLTCKPAIGALAAGNVVVLKPSELAPASSAVLARRVREYLDPGSCVVLLADGPSTERLIRSQRFDYIFCTSSRPVGARVLAAAAQQLTPATLELGGKSPCIIHSSACGDADLTLAAKRILWGKLINLGQTCIAPDYIIVIDGGGGAAEKFVEVARRVLEEWYGGGGEGDFQPNPDLPRIVNESHFKRLAKMLANTHGTIALGGRTDASDLWIEPTIVLGVRPDDATMQEEIFGPILPMLTVGSLGEAEETVQRVGATPLALYIFSKDQAVIDSLLHSSKLTAGSVCVNDSIWQNAWDGLPFGGVGSSGMGKYHGRHSFDTFSHRKSVLHRGFSWVSEKLGESRYPPYTAAKVQIFKLIVYNFHRFDMPAFGLGLASWTAIFLTAALTFGLCAIFQILL